MTPYTLRLCCLSLAVWFIVQSCLGVLIRFCLPRLTPLAERFDPSRAATVFLLLRWLPAGCGLFVAACLCVPTYLRFEPLASEEEMGLACVTLACLAAFSYAIPFARTVFSLAQSEMRLRELLRDAEEQAGVCVIRKASPSMALVGFFHSRVLVSREVMELLPFDQMDAALRHERAHREAGDNVKRLLLQLAPLDGSGRKLKAAWARFTEWAADDRATEGDGPRSVALASALVSVARLTSPECLAHASMLVHPDGRDLRVRVERLLEPSSRPTRRFPMMAIAAAAGVLAALVTSIAQQPALAALVHDLLEALVD